MPNPIEEVPEGEIQLPDEGYVAPSVIKVQVRKIQQLDRAEQARLLVKVKDAAEKALTRGDLFKGILSILKTLATAVMGFTRG
jgi:hypothetical protein